MTRSMRLTPKQGVDGQLRVNEGTQEITFPSVKAGGKGTDERVLSLRTEV